MVQKQVLLFCLLTLTQAVGFAGTFPLPEPGNDIVGQIRIAHSAIGDDFHRLARQYDVGYYELVEANPNLAGDQPLPRHTAVLIPERYILPNVPRTGIVINLAEMRLYYFPKNQNSVITYPIGIGRLNWLIPLGKMSIVDKRKHPTWTVPKSVKEWAKSQGRTLPNSVPPGPNNPLGDYSLRLSHREFLIHSTNDPSGVGMRCSSGCIRMFPEDIAQLWYLTQINTPVFIINDAYKVGWYNHRLYLEVHEPLQEIISLPKEQAKIMAMIKARFHQALSPDFEIDLGYVRHVLNEQSGIPRLIGAKKLLSTLKKPAAANAAM